MGKVELDQREDAALRIRVPFTTREHDPQLVAQAICVPAEAARVQVLGRQRKWATTLKSTTKHINP